MANNVGIEPTTLSSLNYSFICIIIGSWKILEILPSQSQWKMPTFTPSTPFANIEIKN